MVTVYVDNARDRIVQYDRHDERLTAITLLGPTHDIHLDLRPEEAAQCRKDVYPGKGYVGYRKEGAVNGQIRRRAGQCLR